jgi:predicted AlkP superfamily phosphohydrolase/phosphomutase
MSFEKLRVIIIGLDGATYDLMLPWVKEGYLPTFKRLMEEGSWGELQSTMPPLTGPAWSSFITGKNPGKHGIYDFINRNPQGYDWYTINATHRHGMSLWRLLGDHGRKVVVFNVPVTYPPEAVNGLMISGYLTPPKANDFIFPSTLKSELDQKVGPHSTFFTGIVYSLGREDKFIKAIDEMTDRTIRVMDFLLDRIPWDFFMGVFQSPDLLQHCLWKDLAHPVFGKAVRDQYQKIDRYLKDLLPRLGRKTILFILSDHGFGGLRRQVFLNTWLFLTGFLRLKSTAMVKLKRAIFKAGLVPMKLHKLSIRLGIDLSDQVIENQEGLFSFLNRAVLSFEDVDWEKTVAYAIGNKGIYINLEGREPKGCVKSGNDYQYILEKIRGKLYQMRDPNTDELIIDRVFFKEEIYSGPYLPDAPDLFPVSKGFQYHLRGDYLFMSNHWIEDLWLAYGFHRPNGIFMAFGPGIKKGQPIEGKRIIDLTPTVLPLMGVPIPTDIDGECSLDLFDETFLKSFRPSYCQPPPEEKRSEKVLSEEEEMEIKKSLKSLGYLG